MVKNFRGQVKISDVQEEFDNLTNHINNMVSIYNNAVSVEDNIDYTKASSSIAPTGYTLTIGALKKILNAYNGTVLGSQVYKVGDNKFNVTSGLYITENSVKLLKQGLLQGNGDILYYDLTHNAYTFGDKFIASSEGSTSTVWKNLVLPPMTSNTSWGSMTGGKDDSGTIYSVEIGAGETYQLCDVVNGKRGYFGDSEGNTPKVMFKWVFQEPVKFTKLTYDITGDKSAYFKLMDLDRNEIATYNFSSMTKEWTSQFVSIPAGKTVNGFIIEYGYKNRPIGATKYFGFGNLVITGQTSQEVYIPAGATGNVDKNNLLKITDLNTNRISPLCNTPNFVAENIPDFKLGSNSVLVNYGDSSVNTLNNSEKGQFIGVFREPKDKKTLNVNFLGEQVIHAYRREYNNAAYFAPLNRLFLPKGIANPYTGQEWQICLDYTVQRQQFKQT